MVDVFHFISQIEESTEKLNFFEEPEKYETFEDDSEDQYGALRGEEEPKTEEDPFWSNKSSEKISM